MSDTHPPEDNPSTVDEDWSDSALPRMRDEEGDGQVGPLLDEELDTRRFRPTGPVAKVLYERIRTGGSFEGETLVRFSMKKKVFEGELHFDGCELERCVFSGCQFKEKVVFKNCLLERTTFRGSQFEKGVDFIRCEFRGPSVRFQSMRIGGAFRARNCLFTDRTVFDQCMFGGLFDGWDSRARGWVDFSRCTWEDHLDLRSIQFEEGVVFRNSFIRKDLLFRGVNIQKKLTLEGTSLGGCFDLQKAKLHDFAYLQDLNLQPGANFRFWNSIPQALLIRPQQLAGRLASEQENDHATAAEEYGILKNNFARLNWLDEEDWAYYRFKQASWRARRGRGEGGLFGSVGRFLEWLIFDKGCGYGTMPMRVLLSAVLVILFFAMVYCLPLITHGIPDYDSGEQVGASLKTYRLTGSSKVDAVATALIGSTSAFVSGFDALAKDVDGWLAVALTLEGLSGMLLLGLFIVSFSRKVIR